MGTEIRKIISGVIDFNTLSRELTVVIDDDPNPLLDVLLSFYTLPTMIVSGSDRPLVGGEDFRLLVNQYDVTGALKKELKSSISRLDTAVIRQQYLQGAEAYRRYVESLGILREETAGDDQKIQEISRTTDWSSQFDKLGDRQVGWSGNLHPLSFLYRFISISAISLNNVWETYRMNPLLPPTLNDIPFRTLTFAQGPSSLLGKFDPVRNVPAGRLVFEIETLRQNPLEQPLNDILKRLRKLNEDIESIRINYLDVTLSRLEKAERDLSSLESSVNSRLEQLTRTVSNIG